MDSSIKQVPRKRVRFRIAAVPRRVLFPKVFPEVPGVKRQYPGAREGGFLAGYLNKLSARPQKQRAFLGLLSTLLDVEQMVLTTRRWKRAFWKLVEKIDRQGSARVTEDGLVIPPTSDEGKAALAALLLYRHHRLRQIQRCLHCRTWFYAHLERQRFCSDRAKRCQWKHYHSPAWRKRNRERNRKHQRAYRERTFVKRGKR